MHDDSSPDKLHGERPQPGSAVVHRNLGHAQANVGSMDSGTVTGPRPATVRDATSGTEGDVSASPRLIALANFYVFNVTVNNVPRHIIPGEVIVERKEIEG